MLEGIIEGNLNTIVTNGIKQVMLKVIVTFQQPRSRELFAAYIANIRLFYNLRLDY